jgi:hypothetical protein
MLSLKYYHLIMSESPCMVEAFPLVPRPERLSVFPITFPFESHSSIINKSDDSTLVFILREQRGFTKKLLKEALSDTTYKVFLNGPYGSPPLLIDYQTVIFIAGLFLLSLHLALLIIYLL